MKFSSEGTQATAQTLGHTDTEKRDRTHYHRRIRAWQSSVL